MATGKEGVLREVARGELLLLGNPHASYPGCQVQRLPTPGEEQKSGPES